MPDSPSKAIVPIKQHLSRYFRDPTWQRAWLELEPVAWRSLAVIPTGDFSSLDVVHGLAAVAWQQRGTPLVVADIQTIELGVLSAVREELRRRILGGERVLIASRSLSESPAAATIAREADGVILCVSLGGTKRKAIASAIRELGKQRIVGTLTLQPVGY
jgi:hypothetical protein